MTWTETHERTRIIREVEAVSSRDLSGAIPWREEWAQFFDGPAGLVAVLRSRWENMCATQLDSRASHDDVNETLNKLRCAEAGVLAILDGARNHLTQRVLMLTGSAPVAAIPRKRIFSFSGGGPVIPSVAPRRR